MVTTKTERKLQRGSGHASTRTEPHSAYDEAASYTIHWTAPRAPGNSGRWNAAAVQLIKFMAT